jgi:transcriptional regulator with XRE-family HTH domain
MANPYRIIGKTLRLARKSKGYTQEFLAEAIGVHRVSLARWEKGECEPSMQQAFKLALLLDLELPALLSPEWIKASDLKDIPLKQLQNGTAAALKVFPQDEILSRVPEIPGPRLQRILQGLAPTAYEIHLFRERLGSKFQPGVRSGPSLSPESEVQQMMMLVVERLQHIEFLVKKRRKNRRSRRRSENAENAKNEPRKAGEEDA